jgi:hypothetical protein
VEEEEGEQEEPKNVFRGRGGSFNHQNKLFFAVVDAKAIKAGTEDVSEEKIVREENEGEEKELMKVDPVKQKFNKKTMKDEHGNYPVWMNRREVKNRSITNRKNKLKQKKKRLRDKQKKKH